MKKLISRKLVLCALLLCALGGAFGVWVLLHPASIWVQPWRAQQSTMSEQVIFGPYPVEDDFVALKKRGVTTIVSLLDSEAPNLLTADLQGNPIQLNFNTNTYDFEVGHTVVVGGKHILTFGGNARYNDFEISIAPDADNRTELGAYFQDEIFFDKFRFVLGARVDKFANIDDLRQILLKDRDQLARALAEKLVTYATGAAPTAPDKPDIEAIVQKVRDNNYGVRSLVHEVVQSKLFRHK